MSPDTLADPNKLSQTHEWDGKSAYFTEYENGEFSPKQKAARTETLENGERIFRDIGVTFYVVEKGDTILGIRRKLSKYPEFAYLNGGRKKMKGFNIPANLLQPGMLLPIPKEEKDRQMSDIDFAKYCQQAITNLLNHPRYGNELNDILSKVGEKELIAVMIAAAKQESGGSPLGQFVFHRWEPDHKVFSFSIFHIVQKGAGLKARQNLDMTKGQLYHPKNAGQIFLAYLIEKSGSRASDYFPISNDWDAWARMYNGKYWKTYNPGFVVHMKDYYKQANELLNGKKRGRSKSQKAAAVKPAGANEAVKQVACAPEHMTEATFWCGGNTTMERVPRGGNIRKVFFDAVKNSNWNNSAARLASKGETILGNNHRVKMYSKRVREYLVAMNPTSPYDKEIYIGVGEDAKGDFVLLQIGAAAPVYLRVPADA